MEDYLILWLRPLLNTGCLLTYQYYELNNTFTIAYSLSLTREAWTYSCISTNSPNISL
ncbi:MAG: hypothetical protein ACJAZP_001980 [Psychromonas sp.]|jgi:hypothetical protein